MVSALPSPEHMLRIIEDPDVPRDRLVATLTVDLAEARAQDGAENAPSRAADGLAWSGWHSGTPATGEARKSAESDADDEAEWDAREAIERARGGR